jgi:flagella basal body P-ring formation protein FlgA
MLLIALAATLLAAMRPSPAQAQQDVKGLRASRALARGDTIREVDVAADSGSTVDPRSILGLVTRRVIRSGELLRSPGIGPAVTLRAGTAVAVWATSHGVAVRREGVALHDAGKGEAVRVRLNARVIVGARVRDSANVVLP